MPANRNPLRIVVTGRRGQVARALAERQGVLPNRELVHTALPDFDLSEPAGIAERIAALKPDIVINAAAFTAVDEAESNPDMARIVNADAAGSIAEGAALAGVPVIQMSTDYVFDGALERAYRETDPTGPLGVYGRTKLAGEEAVRIANPRHVILRTSWIYSPYGRNFVGTMLRLAATRDVISVVDDQFGNPTSAFNVADAIGHVINTLAVDPVNVAYGTYHIAGTGSASWYEFAEAVFELSSHWISAVPELRAIRTTDYRTPAQRPKNSRLETGLFESTFGYRAPSWRDSLLEVLNMIEASAGEWIG